MPILVTFKQLVEFVSVLPKLANANAENRQQIRDAVGTVADELIRGLGLVQSRIEGAKVIARSSEPGAEASLQAYLAETQGKLFEAFSEFKICRGLRETRDRFTRPFDLAKASVRTENIEKIDRLLYDLQHDERLIIDDIGPLLSQLIDAAHQSNSQFLTMAKVATEELEKRQKKLRKLAREAEDAL
ncbi:hypothetical protein [Rhodoferax sp. WC2427]|uniref:hypothetical protein n=1 Tax=Rhodoferax sp. WC2427 TaxID=3234144 RepID=UPI003465C89A